MFKKIISYLFRTIVKAELETKMVGIAAVLDNVRIIFLSLILTPHY